MFDRSIVATDLSPASYAVVRCLGRLRTLGAEHCLLLQCIGTVSAASTALSYDTSSLEAMLDEQRAILGEHGFSVETRIVVGSPKQEIVRTAREEAYSLIVVGTQGRSQVAERLLGGVAYAVINHATTPVLAMPVEMRDGAEQRCKPVARCDFTDHVLYATDFSAAADHAFAYLRDIVAAGVRKVTLVHVQDVVKLARHSAERMREFDDIDHDRLETLRDSLRAVGSAAIDVEIVHGSPSDVIIDVAERRDVQLVVMATQGRGFVGELVLGSVSHKVVRRSPAPVLLIPPRA